MKKRYARILAATLSAAMVFTSAPTAVFATELGSVVEDVTAEGTPVAKATLDQLFPGATETITVQKGGSTLTFGSGFTEGEGTTGTNAKADAADVATVAALPVGRSGKVTFTTVVADTTTNGIDTAAQNAGYTVAATDKVSKEFTVTCVGAVATSGLVNLPTNIKAEYGTGVVALTNGDGSVDYNWTVKSTNASLRTAVVGSAAGAAVIESKDSFKDLAKTLDMTESLKSKYGEGKASYNEETGKISVTVDVTVVCAKIDPKTIVWPSSLTKTYTVGDPVAAPAFAETASCAYGHFEVDENSNKIATTAAGTTPYTIKFVADSTKYEIDTTKVDQSTMSATSSSVTRYAPFLVTVGKKVVKADSIKEGLISDGDYPFGTTYGQLINGASSAIVQYDLESGVDEDALIPVGTNAVRIKATLLDTDNYVFEGGNDRIYIPFTVKVAKAETTFEPTAQLITSGKPEVTFTTAAAIASKISKITYQWYKADGTAVAGKKVEETSGAITNPKTYDSGITTPGSYYCKVTIETDDEAVKAALGSLTFTSPEITLTAYTDGTSTVDTLTFAGDGVNTSTSKASYGKYKNATVSAQVTAGHTGYEATYKAYMKDASGKKTDLTCRLMTIGSNKHVVADIPADLNAGKYTFVIEQLETKADEADVALANAAVFEVEKVKIGKTLLTTKDGKIVKFEKKEYEYGTKIADIKFEKANSEIPGTFVINKDSKKKVDAVGTGSGAIKLDFKLSEEEQKNYAIDTTSGQNPSDTYTFDTVRRKVTVTASDITINVGDKLPTLSNKAFKVTGLEEDTNFEEIVIESKTSVSYAPTAEANSKVAGTYAEAIRISVALRAGMSTNYVINEVEGKLIVVDPNAKPSTPPTVAPTPAPVKQATAAAPKAKVAKKTVKVGKKYTFKVKYASVAAKKTVKKVKWTSSKKKVATVSSKGKVTAKKAGKTTIYATITFKDGSKKKVKFTVTVK